MENVNPQLRAHESAWREEYSQSQWSKHTRKGAFTKRHHGRLWEDGGLENAHRRKLAEQALQKRQQAQREQEDAVRQLEEEAAAVAKELEEIRHRNRLKAERAERRRIRHQKFMAARTIANAWRCACARACRARRRQQVAATTVQIAWRQAMDRAAEQRRKAQQAARIAAAVSLQCFVRSRNARVERSSRARAYVRREAYMAQQRPSLPSPLLSGQGCGLCLDRASADCQGTL